MIVKILSDIFEASSNNYFLNKLFNVLEGRYDLDIEAYEVVKESAWYKTEVYPTKTMKEMIDLMLVSTATKSNNHNEITISSNKTNTNFFLLEEAIKYLEQPFSIIFENSNNDSIFFETLLRSFKKESLKIKEFKNERWLSYSMAGGDATDNIETELKSFDSNIFTKEKHKYLRCFVLTDSDTLYPNMDLKSDKQKLKDFLDKNEVKYHFLEKRELENYLPDEVFKELINSENKDYIEAYLRLSSEQKDFFDIEKGFPDKKFDDLKPDEFRELFKNISELDKRTFRKYDLRKINGKNFKSEFPKLFLHEKVTKETLLKRTEYQNNKKELIDILKKIEDLL